MAECALRNAQLRNKVRETKCQVLATKQEMVDDTLTFCDCSISFSVLKLF